MTDRPRVLAELGAELDRVAERVLDVGGSRAGSFGTSPRLRVAGAIGMVAAVAVVLGVVTVILLAAARPARMPASPVAVTPTPSLSTSGSDRAARRAAREKIRAATPNLPADLEQAFPAFQRSSTSADAVPSSVDLGGLRARYGVDPSLARLVLSTGSINMWILPSPHDLCSVVVQANGAMDNGYCATNSVAETRGLVMGDTSGGSGAPGQMWWGVMPAGVTGLTATDESGAISVPVNADGGFAQVVSKPVALGYIAPGGSAITIPSGPNRFSTTLQRHCPLGNSTPLCQKP